MENNETWRIMDEYYKREKSRPQEIPIFTRVVAGDDEMFCVGMYCLSSGNYSEAYKCFSSITDERLRGTSRLCVAYYQLRNNDIDEFDKTIYSACLYDKLTRSELLYIVTQYETYCLQFDRALKGYDEAVRLLYPDGNENHDPNRRPVWLPLHGSSQFWLHPVRR